ncbi:hypothetical protein ACP70R_019647 [Stipagrostis hirtigluma subsp. patula]
MSLDYDSDGGDGGGGAKRRRVDEQGEQRAAAEAEVDRISALPDELRQRILTHLPLKDAIRTGALARGWRGLWRSRWAHRSAVEIHLRSRDAPQRELDALEREPRPRRRLDRFSLTVEKACNLKSSELRRFVEYSAECRVEDLHVDRRNTNARKLSFHLPFSSPILARLSLSGGISISSIYYKGAQPFHALEVIRLRSVSIWQAAFKKMLALCPNLRTLDLLGCRGNHTLYSAISIVWPGNLRSVTMAECDGMALGLRSVPSLRSFRFRSYSGHSAYSSSFLKTPYFLPGNLADLYIYFGYLILLPRSDYEYFNILPDDLSNLTVLTICDNALPVVASLFNGATARTLKLSNLHNLAELQLLMSKMSAVNVDDIYVFLKACRLPNLERLFIQLPYLSYELREGSHGVLHEELPKDGLDRLKIVKVMNFSWRSIEIKLVSFLMSKASSLHKLLLVSPKVAPLDMPGIQEADHLLLREVLTSGKIMLSESDDVTIQPYHSEVFKL